MSADRVVAYRPSLAKLAGGVLPALLLSQMLYVRRADGVEWLRRPAVEWMDSTGMTPRELRTAREALRKSGLILTRRAGFPCVLEYKVCGIGQ